MTDATNENESFRYCSEIKISWKLRDCLLFELKIDCGFSYDAAPGQYCEIENFAKLKVPILLELREDCKNIIKKKDEQPFLSAGFETSIVEIRGRDTFGSAFGNRWPNGLVRRRECSEIRVIKTRCLRASLRFRDSVITGTRATRCYEQRTDR